MTTGGPQTIYWGGLAQGRVRYFDSETQRPGLPQDVAALVTKLEAQSIDLTLVNLSPSTTREVIKGAGSFGEHRFFQGHSNTEELNVDDTYFQVHLQPATEIELTITMKRYCNTPNYRFPWHENEIPFR